MQMFKNLEKPSDKKNPTIRLFYAIANYSMYSEEPDFADLKDGPALSVIWPVIQHEIDMSIDRRRRGFERKQATEEKYEAIRQAAEENQGASVRGLAEITGYSKSSVGRALITRKPGKGIDIEAEDTDNNSVPF